MKTAFLMCRPDFFEVNYEINPWMRESNPVNKKRAGEEFKQLVDLYKKLGAKIEIIKPRAGLPDMVFTANGAVVRDNIALISNFRYLQRKAETALFSSWFHDHGFKVITMPAGSILEGQGEAFFVNGHLFAGYGFRANAAGHSVLSKTFNRPVISLKLVDPRWYHLDTCFCPLGGDRILYYPGAFDNNGIKKIKRHTKQAIPVSQREALDFICNSVPIDDRLITGATPNAKTKQTLKNLGYKIIHTPLGEFKKSGGGARCLTLNIRS